MINNEITETLRLNLGNDALNLDAFRRVDASLLQFYEQNLQQHDEGAAGEEQKNATAAGIRPGSSESIKSGSTLKASPGKAFIKACSEAIFFGVAHCIKQDATLAQSIRENLHPIAHRIQSIQNDTKLLVNVLTGGKIAASSVKFAHFYLICDGKANPEVSVANAFRTFLSHLKSKFTTGKGGDSAFKVMPDGSYYNAYPTIADSFKFIEEAITVSNANGSRPGSTGRAGTALSGKSKSDAVAEA